MNSLDKRLFPMFFMALFLLILIAIAIYGRSIRRHVSVMKTRHDLNRQLRTDNISSIREEVRNAEDDQMRSLKQEYTKKITGYISVDALLQKLASLCETNGVTLIYRIRRIPDTPLSEHQIVSLIGNLLDNAIEAARTVNGTVVFESRIIKGQWILTVENSKSADETPLLNGMRTTKEHGEHGLGTSIIDSIVAKADGFIKRTDTVETFRIFIAIPIQ